MKILWVKAGGLVPPDVGGRIRSYHILRELATRHSITFFSFYAEHPDDIHAQLTEIFERVVCIPLRIPVPRRRGEAFHFVRYLLSPLPYSVAKHSRKEVVAALCELLSTESYDIIICDFAVAGGVIPWSMRCPKVLFAHNVEAQIWHRQFRSASNPIWKIVAWCEYKKMLRYERRCVKNADHVFTVSENDRDAFTTVINRKRITVIPTGVDTEYFQPALMAARPYELVFTGAMDWIPNEDAILHFVRQILPLIHREIPQVTLTVAGRLPSRRLLALAKADNRIRITGRVEDIRPYVREASVFVVPMRVGSGTRLKIFEAMAMGKAVVSTSIGAEGLPVTDGQDIVIADTPERFACGVVSLLRQPEQCKSLGLSARSYVEQKHSWKAVADVFEGSLSEVVRAYGDEVNAPAVEPFTQVGVSQ